MPPVSYATPTSNRTIHSSGRSTSSYSAKKNARSETGSTTRIATATKGRQVIKKKAISKLKVSKLFKEMVAKCDEKLALTGVQTNRYFDSYYFAQNLQVVYTSVGSDTLTPFGKIMFHPSHILDAASCLYNGKVPSLASHTTPTGNFPGNIKITVKNAHSRLHFKNDTQRTMAFTIYEVGVKSTRTLSGFEPDVYWQACLNDDTANAIALKGIAADALFASQTIQTLGQCPLTSSAFKKVFKITKQDVVMESGQTWTKLVQGPKDTVYDYSKFTIDGAGNDWQPGMTVGLMIITKPDLVAYAIPSGTLQFVGRGAVASPPTYSGALLVERYDTIAIEIPEQAGFTYPSSEPTGSFQPLNEKKRVYQHNVYTQALNVTASTVVNVNEENPAVVNTV